MQEIDLIRRSLTTSLFQASRQWRRRVSHILTSHGVSEACATLLLRIHRLGGGGMQQVTLASHSGVKSTSIVRLLDQLEDEGLILRKDEPGDRRANSIYLTIEGEKCAEQMENLLALLRQRLLSGISKSDLKVALRVLEVFNVTDESTVELPEASP